MTHPALALLIGPEFDEFLCAPIGADRNGTGLSVLSALARLNVDPWQEATSLARMPREAAVVRLTALIDALPNEGTIVIPTTIAADLIAPVIARCITTRIGCRDQGLADVACRDTAAGRSEVGGEP